MVDVTVVRYSFEGEKFEILVKPDPALDYKLGKKKDLSSVLVSDDIYTDSSKGTKDNDTIVFPGKVLGTGNVPHKITLCSFSISESAATKIIEGGGKLITHSELIEKFPTGKGVILLG
jgi:large subunit ribosomal protein L18e